MSDHEAFLARIIKRPGDDGPRLMYADWLEQRGECDRAEFIRVQVELAAMLVPLERVPMGVTHTFADAGPGLHVPTNRFEDYKTLRRCALELLEVHSEEWFRPCFAVTVEDGQITHLGTPAGFIRRGFVEEIALSWEDWAGGPCPFCDDVHLRVPCECRGTRRTQGHHAAILASQPVGKVELTTWPTSGEWCDSTPAGRSWLEPLKLRWPGIEFVLPAGVSDFGTIMGQMMFQQVADQYGIPVHHRNDALDALSLAMRTARPLTLPAPPA